MNESNNQKFRELIDSECWDKISDEHNVHTQFEKFNDIYVKHYNTAYPTIKNKVRRKNERKNSKPWILPWLEDAIKRKQESYHNFVKNNSKTNKATYSKLKFFCKKHVNLAKKKYYKKIFDEHKENSKKQWQMINSLLNRNVKKSSPIKLQNESGNVFNTPIDVATEFNKHFSSIAVEFFIENLQIFINKYIK